MPDCPICHRPLDTDAIFNDARFRPFCSKRCADVDLGRWFTGTYAVPAPPPELDDGAYGDGDSDNTA